MLFDVYFIINLDKEERKIRIPRYDFAFLCDSGRSSVMYLEKPNLRSKTENITYRNHKFEV